MIFILQIYCPIHQSDNDRILYLFSCLNPQCNDRKNILLRVVHNSNGLKQSNKLFEDEWSVTESYDQSILEHKFDENLSLNKLEKYDRNIFVGFTPYFITVIDEPDDQTDMKKYEEKFSMKDLEEEVDENEKYEKNYPKAFENDKTNYKFYKQLHKCPEQILRYDWSGKPLMSRDENIASKLEKCPNCNSKRIFEFQLLPSLINHLWKERMAHIETIDEFETILFYTCGKNCNIKLFNSEQIFLFQENFKEDFYAQARTSLGAFQPCSK